MPEHDLEKLLGGFAADTLTAEEKQQLYRAALRDQDLFNALADEQALKELLTDPLVRRRLLQSLQATSAATAGTSPTWRDWFRRPAGLAWAGGLATAACAVILGTKIYQDSLQEASRSIATEDARPVAPSAATPSTSPPVTPPTNEPEFRANEHVETPATSPRKEALAGKVTKQKPLAVPKTQQPSTAAQPERDVLREQLHSTTDTLIHAKKETQPATDQTIATRPKPLPPTSVPVEVQASAGTTTPSQATPSPSARFLFYGRTRSFADGLMAEEKERPEKPLAESTQPSSRMELKKQRFAAGKTTGQGASIQPLGIRYSIQTDGTADQNHERTAGFTGQARRITLMIESNHDGYLQVWEQTETLPPHLLYPVDQQEQLASELAAHEPVNLSLQATLDTLMIRFSRTSSSKMESTTRARPSPNQLRESVTSDVASGSQEQATYVVNQDFSLSEIVIRIPISQP